MVERASLLSEIAEELKDEEGMEDDYKMLRKLNLVDLIDVFDDRPDSVLAEAFRPE